MVILWGARPNFRQEAAFCRASMRLDRHLRSCILSSWASVSSHRGIKSGDAPASPPIQAEIAPFAALWWST